MVILIMSTVMIIGLPLPQEENNENSTWSPKWGENVTCQDWDEVTGELRNCSDGKERTAYVVIENEKKQGDDE